jgi:hypothetical protein
LQKTKHAPTVEDFLKFIPKKSNYEWYKNDQNLVSLKVPKFTSNLGKSFCKLIRKENTFTANFDKLGSIVWINCDGEKNVKNILDIIKKEFPNEKDIDQRLFLFLQQMKSLNYIDF